MRSRPDGTPSAPTRVTPLSTIGICSRKLQQLTSVFDSPTLDDMRKVVLSVRVTPAEERLLQRLAKTRDVPVSQLVREAIKRLLLYASSLKGATE